MVVSMYYMLPLQLFLVMLMRIPLSGLLLTVVLSFSHFLGRWLGFNREDRIVLQFCGSKKSLASGLPMANVLFAHQPGLGLIILPIMIYNQTQIIVGALVARRYERQAMQASDSADPSTP